MHGAKGGAPTGQQNGSYLHGARTKETFELIRQANELARTAQQTIENLSF